MLKYIFSLVLLTGIVLSAPVTNRVVIYSGADVTNIVYSIINGYPAMGSPQITGALILSNAYPIIRFLNTWSTNSYFGIGYSTTNVLYLTSVSNSIPLAPNFYVSNNIPYVRNGEYDDIDNRAVNVGYFNNRLYTNSMKGVFYQTLAGGTGTVLDLTSNVWSTVTNFTADVNNYNLSGTDLVTNLVPGVVNVHYTASYFGTSLDMIKFAIATNDVVVDQSIAENIVYGTNILGIAGVAQLTLETLTNVLCLKVQNMSSDNDITIRHATMVVNRIY